MNQDYINTTRPVERGMPRGPEICRGLGSLHSAYLVQYYLSSQTLLTRTVGGGSGPLHTGTSQKEKADKKNKVIHPCHK